MRHRPPLAALSLLLIASAPALADPSAPDVAAAERAPATSAATSAATFAATSAAPQRSSVEPALGEASPPLLSTEATPEITGRGNDLPQPFRVGGQPAWFLLGGVSAGYTALGDRGGFIGGELSLARLLAGRTLGLYADAYYDFGADGTYVSAGPELGWKFVALDGGFAARFDDGADGTDLGATARLCLTAGVFSLCGRYSRFSADADNDVVQLGALFKLPLISPSGGYR